MTTGGMSDRACSHIIHSVPDCEKHVVVALHLKGLIQTGEHLSRIEEVGGTKPGRADDIYCSHREQRRAHPMSAHIEKVNGQVVFIDPMVAKRIPAEFGGWLVCPGDFQWL